MVSIEEAQTLMMTLIELRTTSKKTEKEEDIRAFRKHQELCIDKFYYLVSMRTKRYKSFPNYEDLNQEGLEMLVRAMNNYNPEKGNFFWWAHKYIDTRISRSANTHTVIRFPLKFAKLHTPHRENKIPTQIDKNTPEKITEVSEVETVINLAMTHLDEQQKYIINLAFGFDGNKPTPVSNICRQLNVSRFHCMKVINNALDILRENIKL